MSSITMKSLNRLPRSGLIDLALKWLDQHQACQPYLTNNRSLTESEEEDYLYTPADNVENLRKLYRILNQDVEEATKQDIVDRIIDGDWRRGMSLHQLAMIDLAYLEHHDTALRWSALKLVPRQDLENRSENDSGPVKKKRKLSQYTSLYPQISPTSFVAALKSEISPLVKAHYHLHRLPPPFELSILRLYISPRKSFPPNRSSIPKSTKEIDSGRVMYIALPNSCPYVYISLNGSNGSAKDKKSRDTNDQVKKIIDMATMKKIILEAIPKAMSRPQERWALESTNLTTKSLKSICELRGNQRPGTSGGTYEKFHAKDSLDTSPVNIQVEEQKSIEYTEQKIEDRFGSMKGTKHAALDRVNIKIKDVVQSTLETQPRRSEDSAPIVLTFIGSDVFLGLKNLVGLGSDFAKLNQIPTWMTGESNMSNITVS